MNTWRDNKGAPSSRTSGPLSVGDRRPSVSWVIGEVHHIAPDYERMRRVYAPLHKQRRWVPILAIVAAVALVAVIYG